MIGLLGTGLMGYPIAERLLEQDYRMIVYNRTAEKATPLKEHGAQVAVSPGEVIESSESTILMLTDAPAIRQLLFDGGEIDFQDRTIIQMGTIAPEESRELLTGIHTKGGEYLEAPVLGNKHHARDGELDVMVGGTEELFDEWQPLLSAVAKAVRHIGPVGSAAALKLALNQFIATLTASFGYSLRLIQANDVDMEIFMDILRDSALYAHQYDKKLPRILEGDYSDPNFPTRHLLKDVDLMLQAGETAGLETAALRGVREIMENAMDRGFADRDYSSLVEGVGKSMKDEE